MLSGPCTWFTNKSSDFSNELSLSRSVGTSDHAGMSILCTSKWGKPAMGLCPKGSNAQYRARRRNTMENPRGSVIYGMAGRLQTLETKIEEKGVWRVTMLRHENCFVDCIVSCLKGGRWDNYTCVFDSPFEARIPCKGSVETPTWCNIVGEVIMLFKHAIRSLIPGSYVWIFVL